MSFGIRNIIFSNRKGASNLWWPGIAGCCGSDMLSLSAGSLLDVSQLAITRFCTLYIPVRSGCWCETKENLCWVLFVSKQNKRATKLFEVGSSRHMEDLPPHNRRKWDRRYVCWQFLMQRNCYRLMLSTICRFLCNSWSNSSSASASLICCQIIRVSIASWIFDHHHHPLFLMVNPYIQWGFSARTTTLPAKKKKKTDRRTWLADRYSSIHFCQMSFSFQFR